MGTDDDEITLLSGATGFVGSLVLERLISRGARVVALIRADDDDAARRRLDELAERIWGESAPVAGVRALAADMERERLGLDEKTYEGIAGRAGAVIHCAASIAFNLSEPDAASINVAGTERMVELARRARSLGAPARLVHLSTAYVHGRARGVARETGPEGRPEFRNTYESTKHRAERVVTDLEGAAILRPSIIVGDSDSGWTSSFNVVYMPLRALVGGALTAVPAAPGALLDLIPVDQVVDVICSLLDNPEEAGVIQIVSGEAAPTVERFAELALQHVGRPGVPCDPAAARQIGPYAPYTDVWHPFELARATDLGARPVEIEDLVPRILDHAFAAEWGATPIFRPSPVGAETLA